MPLPRRLALLCWLPAAACLLQGGCVKNTPPRETAATVPADVQSRIQLLLTDVRALDDTAYQLPGATEQADRKTAASCFELIERILPLIKGDFESGEFISGLNVLQGVRQQLANGAADMDAEPAVVQGLRASERLLRSLNALSFDKDADIAAKIDALQKKIGEADAAHGPSGRVLTAQALRGVAGVCRQMSAAIVERAGTDGRPTTMPTTGPATAPVVNPAPKPDAPADPKPNPTPTPKPDPTPAPKPDATPAPKPDATPAPKPDAAPAPKPDAPNENK